MKALQFNFKWSVLMIALMSFASCSKTDDHINEAENTSVTAGNYFSVKAASFKQIYTSGDYGIITFDEYGKKIRLDIWTKDGDYSCEILDEIAKKYYIYNGEFPESGWVDMLTYVPWSDGLIASVTASIRLDYIKIILGNSLSKQPDQVIAGKTCQVFSGKAPDGTKVLVAGWGNIAFRLNTEDEETNYDTTSFSTNIPTDAFALKLIF